MKPHRNSNVPSSARKYFDVSACFCNSEAWSSAGHHHGLLLHLGLDAVNRFPARKLCDPIDVI